MVSDHKENSQVRPDISTANRFWRPGHGALHHAFASPDPAARAAYIEQAAAAAARHWWVETWTNSTVLARHPGISLNMHDTSALLGEVLAIAAARRAAAGEALFRPGDGRLVLAVILDLPDRPEAEVVTHIDSVLKIAGPLGIAVALVLPSLTKDTISSTARESLTTVRELPTWEHPAEER
jgi:hypothetical protein